MCDFGNAVDLLAEKNHDSIGRNALSYSAPEIFEKIPIYTRSVDIYSLGVLMWTLLKGEEPFSNVQTSYHIIVYIKNGYVFERPPACLTGMSYPDSLWTLIERCLSFNASDRPTSGEVVHLLKGISKDLGSNLSPISGS